MFSVNTDILANAPDSSRRLLQTGSQNGGVSAKWALFQGCSRTELKSPNWGVSKVGRYDFIIFVLFAALSLY